MKRTIAIVVSAAALGACGGGGGGSDPEPTTDIPAAAQQDSAALVNYVEQLVNSSSQTSEPVLVGDAVLPKDDTTETSL